MEFANTIKKAMIDNGISGAKELSEQCGVSYYIVLRLLKNDGACRLNDLQIVINFLNVQCHFSEGDK